MYQTFVNINDNIVTAYFTSFLKSAALIDKKSSNHIFYDFLDKSTVTSNIVILKYRKFNYLINRSINIY